MKITSTAKIRWTFNARMPHQNDTFSEKVRWNVNGLNVQKLVWFSACNLELQNCKKKCKLRSSILFQKKCHFAHFDAFLSKRHKIQCAFDHQYSHYFCGRLPGVAIVKFAWREEWQNWFLTFRSDAPHLTWRIPLEIDEFLRGPFSLLTTVS